MWNRVLLCGKRKTMTKRFTELETKMSPERRASISKKVKEAFAEIPLQDLRNACGLSQKMLAGALHIQQPAVAKMEKRTDMYISTLRRHIEAMGGELEVIARFPDGDVKISNFSQI
jgi:ribosome-binding protein aMBF1 (putative translation factor)